MGNVFNFFGSPLPDLVNRSLKDDGEEEEALALPHCIKSQPLHFVFLQLCFTAADKKNKIKYYNLSSESASDARSTVGLHVPSSSKLH